VAYEIARPTGNVPVAHEAWQPFLSQDREFGAKPHGMSNRRTIMKRILFAAAALAAVGFNTSAMADASASAAVTFSGTNAETCTLGTPVPSAQTNAVATPGASTTTVAMTLTNSTSAALNAGGFTLTYAGMCDYAHSVGIKATNGGLLNASAVANAPVAGSGAFIQRIGYTSSVAWAGATTTGPAPANDTAVATGDTPSTVAIQTAVLGSNRGPLVLTVGIAADATPVVAGLYSETLTLKIGAII
jgi:hypothetical protein